MMTVVDPRTALTLEQMKAASQRLYVEIFGAGRVDAADEIMTASCVSHGPGTPPVVGTDPIKRQANLLRARGARSQASSLEDQVADGDRVASRWHASGTNTGPLRTTAGSVPPTGRRVAFSRDAD